MLLSQRIAKLIEEMLEESNGELSIGRNELAQQMGCVPSQINYVITSRFTPANGYIVESKRGGGGYIRIKKVAMSENEYLMHFYRAIGDSIEYADAAVFISHLENERIISEREGAILLSCLSERSLYAIPAEARSIIRAEIFKNAILCIISK